MSCGQGFTFLARNVCSGAPSSMPRARPGQGHPKRSRHVQTSAAARTVLSLTCRQHTRVWDLAVGTRHQLVAAWCVIPHPVHRSCWRTHLGDRLRAHLWYLQPAGWAYTGRPASRSPGASSRTASRAAAVAAAVLLVAMRQLASDAAVRPPPQRSPRPFLRSWPVPWH